MLSLSICGRPLKVLLWDQWEKSSFSTFFYSEPFEFHLHFNKKTLYFNKIDIHFPGGNNGKKISGVLET